MDNQLAEIIQQQTTVLQDSIVALIGTKLFLRALSAELRKKDPAFMDAVIANIKSGEVNPPGHPSEMAGKEYALVIAKIK